MNKIPLYFLFSIVAVSGIAKEELPVFKPCRIIISLHENMPQSSPGTPFMSTDDSSTRESIANKGIGFSCAGREFAGTQTENLRSGQLFSQIAAKAEKDNSLAKTLPGASLPPLPDLPLTEVQATGENTNLMAIHLTGDGGWGVTDRGIAESLAAKGIPVVALNSLHYFWKQKTVEQTAADFNAILQHYRARWKRNEVIIIGYSFGADVLPFILNRIPGESLEKIRIIAYLGLSSQADFQFHWSDWFASGKRSTSQAVRPEVEKLRGKKMLCFYGTNDGDALCRQLDAGLVKAFPLPGGHRFGKGYKPIVDAILQEAK
jgi:type IV secretory pathway VirJ component